MQNQANGLLFPGCQYENSTFEDIGSSFVLIPPEMKIGQTVNSVFGTSIFFSTTFVGLEKITVPAGTFNTIKIECTIQDTGNCSYKETLWFAKDIGLIKVQRSDANPTDCLGCLFVCYNNDSPAKENTPAELVSYTLAESPGLWQNATSSGDGWYYLSPFGSFNTNSSPWIYHEKLGWLYPVGTSTDNIWFYDPHWDGTGGWWWTSSSLFPWVYSATESEWLYFDAGDSTPGTRWFFTSGGQASTH